ncbi:MAG TPA: hypothetical protein VLT82_20240 [Myxococcaceae bacterium]|nr:hypothetical protein [Myxococcaceae bacterium]
MKRFLALCLTTGVSAYAAPISGVPAANIKADGYAPASQLTREWRQHPVAVGAMPVENPDGIVGWYGYENDSPSPTDPTQPQTLPTPLSAVEAQKTEPDKNTYLVLWNQKGADPHYNYGTHFLFQGHELGAKDAAGVSHSYITRINLDADTAHRVTLMATHDVNGNPIAPIDGSTWDPFAQRLLFTTESASAPVYAATLSVPSQVEDVSGALGRGGYEGIQNDNYGNIWIVEDIGGANKPGTVSKRPNSFLYRYVPRHPGDLHNGKLQVLQVWVGDHPATFDSQAALFAPDQVAIRTAGTSYKTRWLTIHDTAVDGTTPFNANTLAKAAGGTPFKRPENGVFRPGSHFREFFFDETGDTNATSVENAGAGGWASIFKLSQHGANADEGRLSIFFQGNQAVAGLDNLCFLSDDLLLVVEDAGDGLHGQRKALDSGFLFDVDADYSHGRQPIRFLAEGRDASATIDSAFGGFGKNEGDNEITGIHVSDGDPSVNGILGAKVPHFGHDGWRMFWTQQHGDNVTWEVTRAKHGDNDDDHDDW